MSDAERGDWERAYALALWLAAGRRLGQPWTAMAVAMVRRCYRERAQYDIATRPYRLRS